MLAAILIIFLFLLTALLGFLHPALQLNSRLQHRQQEYVDDMRANKDAINHMLANRQYVPLELLPNINLNADLSTINAPLLCFQTPIKVTTAHLQSFDCSRICQSDAAQYFFVSATDRFVVNGDVLEEGGYCTTSTIPENCNRETSIVMFSINLWTCIAEDPRYFSGIANSQQVAGRQHSSRIRPGTEQNNRLIDRLLGREVDVTRNTFRTSWDELLDDGSRRFVVECKALDDNNNLMVVNPFNQIECMPNVCTNVFNVHSDVMPNFETGVCECGDIKDTRVTHVTPDDPSSICASVVNKYDEVANTYTFRARCLLPRDRMDLLLEQNVHMFCPPSIFSVSADNAFAVTLGGVQTTEDEFGLIDFTHRQFLDLRTRIDFKQPYSANRSNFGIK